MAYFIHHVPGRLRVKSQKLKRNESFGRIIRDHLGRFDGVLSVELSVVTGSVVILYDTELTSAQAILEFLQTTGFSQDPGQAPAFAAAPAAVARSSSGPRVSDKVLNKIVETVIERSAVALIAALI